MDRHQFHPVHLPVVRNHDFPVRSSVDDRPDSNLMTGHHVVKTLLRLAIHTLRKASRDAPDAKSFLKVRNIPNKFHMVTLPYGN